MKYYDLIVIGFGKAGKTLAGKMASLGKSVALIEKNPSMYGGTCINIACIPTKTLIQAAEDNLSFAEAFATKEAVTSRLRAKNKATVTGAGVDLYDAEASFVSDKVLELRAGEDRLELTGDTIVINTGAVSRIAPIPGLLDTPHVLDSTALLALEEQPKRLGVIGAGNIGLELASLYAHLGSQVTVFESSDQILGRYEPEVAQLAHQYLTEDGLEILTGQQVESLATDGNQVALTANQETYTFDTVLYALGRIPAIEGLGLERTGIQVNDRGAIEVDDYCQTSVAGIYAVGDVNGGPQFTYTSLDDFRIVFGHLTGNSSYKRSDRKNIPTSLFIQPPLAQVGLTEQAAKDAGLPVAAKSLPVANMPRAHVNNDLRGLFKVVVNPDTKEILGATLFGREAHELINLIKMAMDNGIPYTYFQSQVFTHPTMAENLNDVFQL